MLIGNLTRDPELRYTPAGTAVCTIGLATNRTWTTDSGEKKEETEFHRVVAWNKLAELCSQLLTKGRKIYIEGRLRTNNWQTTEGAQRTTTEIIIEDMILLDPKRPTVNPEEAAGDAPEMSSVPRPAPAAKVAPVAQDDAGKQQTKSQGNQKDNTTLEDVNPDDIPF